MRFIRVKSPSQRRAKQELRVKNILMFFVFSSLLLAGCAGKPSVEEGGEAIENSTEVIVDGQFVVGEPAPFFETVTLEGEVYSSEAVFGQKAVILDFWAGWCPYCVNEMPELQAVFEEYGDQVVIVGVHRTDTEGLDIGKEFAQKTAVLYPLITDDGSLYDAAGGFGMPVAVFIDSQGIVQEIKSGPKTKELIQSKVETLLPQN